MSRRPITLLWIITAACPRLPLHPWREPICRKSSLIILRNTAYDCGYSTRLKTARWVSYLYFKTGTERTPRRGRFRPDPRLDSASTARAQDYRNSGFDRGHLAPDATVKVFGRQAQLETYYFSNIIPQDPQVNRGVWRQLEDSIRAWAGAQDTVWATVGPVWFKGSDTVWLGQSRIAVPHACFAVVCRSRTPGAIAFLVPNLPPPAGAHILATFLVSIDSIERLTGLDLYPALSARVESARSETLWRRQP